MKTENYIPLELESKRRVLEINQAGQSIWLDFISACIIQSGNLKRMVDNRIITGITSNPTIFAKEILTGECGYKDSISQLRESGMGTFDIYDTITRRDIVAAADILRPVYDATEGRDGFVSLEVSPELAHEEDETVHEANRLWTQLARPNILIKVPATPEGIPAIRRLIGMGININVTLIFSPSVYREVALAYIDGLRDLAKRGADISKVASVASFFVSRMDTAIDKELALKLESGAISKEQHGALRGRMALANAKIAYQDFETLFAQPDFLELANHGARVQRVLWASTSAKDPSFHDLKYVEPLIGPHTVNTMPSETLAAFCNHGKVKPGSVFEGIDEARECFGRLGDIGIHFESICLDLLQAGVESFSKSFHDLLQAIQKT